MADSVEAATGREAGASSSGDAAAVDWPPIPREVEAAPPVRVREIISVMAIVVLADVTVYRGHGFAGLALLVALSLPLLVLGTSQPRFRIGFWIVAGMLLLLAARLVWLGSALGAGCGLALLVALAVTLQGRPPHVLDTVTSAFKTVFTGPAALHRYGTWVRRLSPDVAHSQWLSILMPLAAIALFGGLFVMANPDVAKSVMEFLEEALRRIEEWLQRVPFHVREVFFWIAVAWFVAGLLWPGGKAKQEHDEQLPVLEIAPAEVGLPPPLISESSWYLPIRNTLVSVIVLFAVYLAYEFYKMWFREFRKGFAFSAYAHEGAAWLTTALAFATLMLSMMFRGRLLKDARIGRLRTLAWLWSAENFLLAVTVYNRLQIYVNYNGMTRMRTVAIFGISAVVLGFLLVVWKIVRNHSFEWLVRNQLWALAIVIFLFALAPVDAIVHRYNARQIMAGDLAPIVPIAVHQINSEGVMMLDPLVDCQDPTIREGIRALLAERAIYLEALAEYRAKVGWTTYQAADNLCLERLRATRENWKEYLDDAKRTKALARFRRYAYQWY